MSEAHVRGTDTPARLGGDEFAIAFECDLANAQHVSGRIAAEVAQHHWHSIAEGLAVTISDA